MKLVRQVKWFPTRDKDNVGRRYASLWSSNVENGLAGRAICHTDVLSVIVLETMMDHEIITVRVKRARFCANSSRYLYNISVYNSSSTVDNLYVALDTCR